MMTTDDLGHIIKESLVFHRFVVVPQVGAFLLRSIPARINPVLDRIDPPKDEIRFNTAIKDDDGLLISAVAKNKGVSRNEAEVLLKDAIGKVQFSLANKEGVTFGPLGVLTARPEGTLVFEESSALDIWPAHFGLPAIPLHALPETKKVSIKQLVPDAKVLATEFPVKRLIGYAAAVAVMVSLGIVPMSDENNRNKAALSFANFTGNKVEVKYTPRTFQPLEVSASYVSDKPENTVEFTPKAEASDTLIEEPEATIKEATEYFVITGAFSSKQNADNLIADLTARGFGGTYVGKFDGKHLVSYGNYSSLADAKGMKASVALGNPDAWVLAGR